MTQFGVPSVTAKYWVGAQQEKGVPATAYVCGIMEQSGLNPQYEQQQKASEHGCIGGNSRVTARKSVNRRTSFVVNGRFRSNMYPNALGYWLLAAGFKCTTTPMGGTNETHTFTIPGTVTGGTFDYVVDGETAANLAYNISAAALQTAIQALTSVGVGNATVTEAVDGTYVITFSGALAETPITGGSVVATNLTGSASPYTIAVTKAVGKPDFYYSHVFTLANRDELGWVSVIAEIEDTPRIATDVRASQLEIDVTTTGIKYSGTLLGLSESLYEDALVAEEELAVDLLPTEGSMTFQLDPAGTPVLLSNTASRLLLTIDNPLNQDTKRLYAFGLGDLPPSGLSVKGSVEGIPIDMTTYRALSYGSGTGTTPDVSTPITSLDFTHRSDVPIPNTSPAVYYSMQVAVARAEVPQPPAIEPEADNLLFFNCDFEMVDIVATPITITLVNEWETYEA